MTGRFLRTSRRRARIPKADKRKPTRSSSAFSGSRFGAGGRLDSRCWAEPVGKLCAKCLDFGLSGPLGESGVGPAPSGVVKFGFWCLIGEWE